MQEDMGSHRPQRERFAMTRAPGWVHLKKPGVSKDKHRVSQWNAEARRTHSVGGGDLRALAAATSRACKASPLTVKSRVQCAKFFLV